MTDRAYLPAAGRDWALPLYDPVVALLGGRRARQALIDRAELRPGQRVLEIGCGTGSLLLAIAKQEPGTELVGLDPDPKALARARRKAARAGIALRLDRGFSDSLPYPDRSFDRVFSAFMLHHLPSSEKEPTLREAARVLVPGGRLYLVDFVGPDPGSHDLTDVLHGHERLRDNAEDRVIALMTRAGLQGARRIAQGGLLFGRLRLTYYEAAAA
jgi:ubiquinone/menaquinone biosynthesis C-methylase UbiE